MAASVTAAMENTPPANVEKAYDLAAYFSEKARFIASKMEYGVRGLTLLKGVECCPVGVMLRVDGIDPEAEDPTATWVMMKFHEAGKTETQDLKLYKAAWNFLHHWYARRITDLPTALGVAR